MLYAALLAGQVLEEEFFDSVLQAIVQAGLCVGGRAVYTQGAPGTAWATDTAGQRLPGQGARDWAGETGRQGRWAGADGCMAGAQW